MDHIYYDILKRFRDAKFGIVADIKQPFLKSEIPEVHRGLVRFLWLQNIIEILLTPTVFRFTGVFSWIDFELNFYEWGNQISSWSM